MNEQEKEAIKELQNKHIFFSEYEAIEDYETENNINTILNLIDKQQKEIESRLEEIDSLYKMISTKDDEIEELKEDNNALEIMLDTANAREYRKKYIEERRKEQPNLYCPDFDEIYERYYKQKAEIEQMKEDYQILKDDIEGHRIVYVDTPEFEEKYISKDKIREKIEELKQYKEEIKGEKDFEYYNALRIIRVLRKLLGE